MSKDVYKIVGNDASNYEEHLGPLIFEPAAKALLQQLLALPANTILEIACGTGRVTKQLLQNYPSSRIVATDINPGMMELAQQQLNAPTLSFQLADALQLPFADNSFDLVVNQFGLMFFPDKQAGVNEAYRVLKAGGHFAFTTWDATANMALFKLLIDEVIVPLFKHEDTNRFYTPFSLHDTRVLNSYLEQAGFKSRHVHRMKFKGHADSPQHILNVYFLNHPLGREVKEKLPAAFDSTAHKLEQALIRQFGTGAFEFELSACIGIGEK